MNEMPQKDAEALQKIIMAGMKVMYDKSTFEIFKKGMTSKQPIEQKLLTQAVGLVKILMDKSNGSIPLRLLLPAATFLLFEMANFLIESGYENVTEKNIERAVMGLPDLVVKVFSDPKSRRKRPPQNPQPQMQAQPQQPAGMINQGV